MQCAAWSVAVAYGQVRTIRRSGRSSGWQTDDYGRLRTIDLLEYCDKNRITISRGGNVPLRGVAPSRWSGLIENP